MIKIWNNCRGECERMLTPDKRVGGLQNCRICVLFLQKIKHTEKKEKVTPTKSLAQILFVLKVLWLTFCFYFRRETLFFLSLFIFMKYANFV